MKYVVKKSDLIGEIKNFTVELVQEMVDEQVRQGNNADVEVFQKQRNADKSEYGFYWDESIKGEDYWIDVMIAANLFDSEQK